MVQHEEEERSQITLKYGKLPNIRLGMNKDLQLEEGVYTPIKHGITERAALQGRYSIALTGCKVGNSACAHDRDKYSIQ